VAGRAVQIVAWDLTHRFCSRCATPTPPLAGERAKKCPACGLVSYPRLTPAVIVAVQRGNTILLARNAAFTAAFYSVLAGFVEPGETLEGTVRREIREEVGIEVRDIRYFGSQPWPFPHSLMIGFTANWAAGELRIDERELADAGWFAADALPTIPPKLSIARRLIDAFVAEESERGG
jgi:NAD+ diphosphatase